VIRPNTSFYIIVLALLIAAFTETAIGQKVRPTLQQVTIERKLIEGKKYALLGDWEKAEASFRGVLEEDPQNSAANYELSRTLTAAGKYADALTYVHKAIRLEPNNEWYLLMEADIHEKTFDLYSAMDVYDKLIQLRPDRPHYYAMLIGFCKKTDERERLLRVLDQYEQLTGVTENITRTRFETLDAMGRTEEALAAIDRLAEAYPTNIEYKYLAASYCKTKGKDDKGSHLLPTDPCTRSK
jgi:tetratricopeptide (TPR) repeat protein